MANITENLIVVKERIAEAARRSGRQPEHITLIAVTKTVDTPRILEALDAGVTDIGENYVQEAMDKWSRIGPRPRWHFIGHLQRNKAKNAVEVFDMVQSIDSLELAEAIGKRAVSVGKTMDVLIEVNIGEEPDKYGVPPSGALELAGRVSEVDGIRLLGMMGMAPLVQNPEESRPYFALLKTFWDQLPAEQRVFLSMGMTMDFDIAIEEGANMVRVGTAIFGARQKI